MAAHKGARRLSGEVQQTWARHRCPGRPSLRRRDLVTERRRAGRRAGRMGRCEGRIPPSCASWI